MKVIELYENTQIASAKEFKDSFTNIEWENIICYYISIMDKNVGVFSEVALQDKPAAMTQMAVRMRSSIGQSMADSTQPQSWNALARQFGIKIEGHSSWQSFYNVLRPHATHNCEIEYAPTTQAQNFGDTDLVSQLYTTKETLQDVLSWIPAELPDKLTFEGDPSHFQQAIPAMINGATASTKTTPLRSAPGPNDQNGSPTPSWVEWYTSTAKDNNEQQPIKDMLIGLLDKLPDSGATKTELATLFLNWLRTADSVINKQRERYDQ